MKILPKVIVKFINSCAIVVIKFVKSLPKVIVKFINSCHKVCEQFA